MHHPIRLPFLLLICGSLFTPAAHAADPGTLIFSDDFERNESQEVTDEIGQGWGTNSKSRAKGNKQVDLRDGAMYIVTHPEADHAASVTHPAEFRNGTVEMRFMLEDAADSLGLNFADLQYKAVHAGHLCMAKVSPKQVQISDLKTGNMDLKTRELRLAGQLPKEIQERLKTKQTNIAHQLEVGQWYDLRVDIDGETMSVAINGKQVGSFTSEGIAHPTKRMLRLSVPREAVVDNVRIYAR